MTGASFVYDPLGRRVSKTIGGSTTSYLYDGPNPVQEGSANLLTGLGIDEYLMRTDSAGARSLLTDALGSTEALTDATGTVQTEYTYEPFGKTTVTGASSTNSFQYTGRESDGTGLYYYRSRYYSPMMQRFVSEDPISFLGGDVNIYTYVSNNPINFTDPYGLFMFPIILTPPNGSIPGVNLPTPSPENSTVPLPPIPYGCYGGGGWTGCYNGQGSPQDSLDDCFKAHDDCYGSIGKNMSGRKGSCPPDKKSCDRDLVDCMTKLPPDPRNWDQPAKHPNWAKAWRRGANWYF
jgi:RHS repeat-associated protein